ncbi:hypothetical protein [Arthrobacter sp. HLT1-20]
MTEQQTPSAPATTGPAKATVSTAVAGPLTIRDLAVLGSVALIFVASLVPIIVTIAGSFNLWNAAGLFYIGVGVILPLAVGGLFLVRRLSPEVKIRIGSLSIDQFASVVACLATFFFFTGTVTTFGVAYLLGLVGSLVLLTATVCAQWIPMLAADFAGRAEVPAHVVARDAVPAVARPSAPKPVVASQNGAAPQTNSGAVAGAAGGAGVGAAASTHTTQQPFAWNAPQAAAGHTAAGQIFTPAKETGAAGTAAGATAGAAAQTVADAAPAATAAAQSATTPAAGAAAGAGAAATVPAAHTTAQPTTTAQPAVQTAAAAPAAVNTSGAVASTRADQSADAPATTLNPQVAEVSAAPATTATPVKESIAATVNPKAGAAPVVADPFWFAVDRPQNVIDEKTRQFVFKLTPGSWILALEDRGSSFLVQDSHGKTGILLDLVGIERASDSQ